MQNKKNILLLQPQAFSGRGQTGLSFNPALNKSNRTTNNKHNAYETYSSNYRMSWLMTRKDHLPGVVLLALPNALTVQDNVETDANSSPDDHFSSHIPATIKLLSIA